MRYLSVCSGIEAATVAWHPLGWTPAAFAEIDAFPSAVLAHHYPAVPNAGDFTELADVGSVDLLVGGTPCQDFSIAGLRAGVAGDRGNLTLEFLRLADRIRPRWMVWENVPGVLSIDGGRTFGAFLGGLAELGYGWAYRVLDAQYFGVAQRRRRVFVVGCVADERRAAAVLFERASVSGHSSPRRKTGTSVAGALGTVPPGGGWRFGPDEAAANQLVAHTLKAEGFDASEDGTGRGVPLIASTLAAYAGRNQLEQTYVPAIFDERNITSPTNRSNPKPGDPAPTMHAEPEGFMLTTRAAVRRLTPVECERLQGFPDDYTLVPYRKKPAVDGLRYRALGNSMAVPVMRWIAQRIQEVA